MFGLLQKKWSAVRFWQNFSWRRSGPHQIKPLSVMLEFCGESCTGKTTILTMLRKMSVDDPLPSRLCISMCADDPRAALSERQRAEQMHKELMSDAGLASTLADRRTDYYVYEGDISAVAVRLHECVGQALTKFDPQSDRSGLYERYLDRLRKAQVILLVVRCPREPLGDDADLRSDIAVGINYLRAALSAHVGTNRRVSVAILITMVDAAFETVQAAQQGLSEAVLKEMLRPLIALIETSQVLYSAVIFPVSAMGFAVRTGAAGGERGRAFNLDALLPWSILQGILPQDVNMQNGQSELLRRVANSLEADLRELKPWMCQIR